ncbi:uncharacterized protein [Phyllobates terribilis]
MNDRFYQNLVENATHIPCPQNIAKFVLPGGIFCGVKGESWVENVISCINQGRLPCLKSSKNQPEIPKDSNDKLPLTTQKTTTSTPKAAPFPEQSTQTWKGGTQMSSESANKNPGTTQKTIETNRRHHPTTASADLDQNKDSRHGISPPAEKEDEKNKKKQMTIAIISLILIVLVMTTIATYFVCRKGKVAKCTTTYNTDVNMVYRQALVEEPEEQEPGGEIIQTSCVLQEENCLQDNIADGVQN